MDQTTLVAMAFKMTVALGAVLLTFGASIFLVRRFSGNSKSFLKKGGAHKPMEVIAFQSLGTGRNLYLLRCLNKKILIGATNASVTHIADIPDDDDNESTAENSLFSSNLQEKISDENTGKGLKSRFKTGLREIARV